MKFDIKKSLVLLFPISIPFLIYFGTATKSQLNIKGTVVDFGAIVDDGGINSFVMVKLDDNRTVKIDYSLASGFNIGKQVLVQERTTELFDMKRYKIIKWYK